MRIAIGNKKNQYTLRGPQGALPQERSGARSPVLEEYIDFSNKPIRYKLHLHFHGGYNVRP